MDSYSVCSHYLRPASEHFPFLNTVFGRQRPDCIADGKIDSVPGPLPYSRDIAESRQSNRNC